MHNIPEAYRPVVEKIIGTMRKFLAEGEELHTFVFLAKFDGNFFPVPMNTSSNRDKEASAYLVTLMSKEIKPDFMIFVSEAWAVMEETEPQEIEKFLKEYKSLAEHPRRQDIVFLTLETRNGIWMGTSPIKSLGGNQRGFDEMKFTESTDATGRFTHFLSPESNTMH